MNSEKWVKWDKWVKVVIVGVFALIVSPIIFLVVQGMVGLLIAGSIGFLAINLAPVISMKVANWKVQMIVSEAKENPIETFTNLIAAKKVAFSTFKTNVEEAASGLKTFEQKSEVFCKQYPERGKEFIAQVEAMRQLVAMKKVALVQAQSAITQAEHKLDEMRAYWDMSQIAQAANKAAGMDTGDQYEKLKSDTACDAVFESVNRAFAQMEVAAVLTEVPSLTNNPSPTLNSMNIINVEAKVRVQ